MDSPSAPDSPLVDLKPCRRVLVCVTGLSPQIITETIYALCVQSKPPWVPDEVRLITTQRGADNARLMLLSSDPGWFHRLRRDWKLPEIAFDASCIEVLRDAWGAPLNDIRDDDENRSAADGIARVIRRLSEDATTEIHASIAGGRKTMGFLLGYAMSLWGRPQDRLSHVLVSPPFESRPEFFYPSPRPQVIAAKAPGQDPIDASTARVWLGDIPFVRLRGLLPAHFKAQDAGFASAVAAANRALDDVRLVLFVDAARVAINQEELRLAPMQFAILCLLAWRCQQGKAALRAPCRLLEDDREWKDEVLADLRSAMGSMNVAGSLHERLVATGPIAETFEQQLSKLQRRLRDSGVLPLRELLKRDFISGRGRQRAYRLALDPSQVNFVRGNDGKILNI